MSARSRFASACAALILCTLASAGCSTPSSTADPARSSVATTLETVTVTGKLGERPTLSVTTPFSVQTGLAKVLTVGTGAKAAAGQRVTIEYLGINGTDGKEFDSSYGLRPTSFVLSVENNLPGLVKRLTGATAGSRMLLALPPEEAYGLKGLPGAGVGPTDTIVLVVDLIAVKDVLARATGTAVKPRAGLPTVALNKKGAPTIKLPETDPPTALVVQPLIIGAGPKVTRGQQITVHYSGVIWPGGQQFDSSWGRPAPASFPIGVGKVIAGWDRGLVGQTVGSQLLLVIPPDDGYGAEGKPEAKIKGTDTLVFVVDILDAA
ncbi:MAG: FKBP-type peptidyl-prolyl cis-trans isomerase [Kineosporiaceae bacterium]|nr:FKBP-type peptidyl-prolyl cis-trans isomerase [Kineosporiaceae bacterium]MBK7624839.1 FKBP-type peptidyl-prolyl cis-trans isomerase [Kineosporiaceae bacterium]